VFSADLTVYTGVDFWLS